MNRIVLFLIFVFAQGCAQTTYQGKLTPLGKFSSKLKEVSGIENTSDGNFWVIEDGGNEDKIYKIDHKAKTIQSSKIDHAKNQDWEGLTSDLDGNLYIGDFGNNRNDRKNLVIYKVSKSELSKKEPKAQKIAFSYPEQKDFPPKKDSLYFDTEGFFHWNGNLYIFTKNRTRPYSGKTLVYRVPDQEGDYKAELLDTLFLCGDQDHCSVTGVDISPDGKTIALLSYGFVFLIKNFALPNFSDADVQTIDLNCKTQIESICFSDNETLFIADEQNKNTGRRLYKFKLD